MRQVSFRTIRNACLLFVLAWTQVFSQTEPARHSGNAGDYSTLRAPFAAVLVFDASGSMSGAFLDSSKAGGHLFIDRMEPDDRAAIMSFGFSPILHATFTRDHGLLHAGIDSIRAIGPTTLWDALLLATQLLEAVEETDRFIVVVSDGADGSSTTAISQVIASAIARSVHITTIGLGSQAQLAELSSVAQQTGGRFYTVAEAVLLPPLYATLLDSLTTWSGELTVPTGLAVSVFPHPGNGTMNIAVQAEQPSTIAISLTDCLGREVHRHHTVETQSAFTLPLPVASLPAGMYLLRVRLGGGRDYARPLVVVH